MKRSDYPAIRDTAIWIGLILLFAGLGIAFWGSWWAVPFFLAYGLLYGSTSDSRWHESGHGTAFKTRWLDEGLYQLASFMIMRDPTTWRWSHTRHHTDTRRRPVQRAHPHQRRPRAAATHRDRSLRSRPMPQWIAACEADDIDPEDVIPFERDGNDYAIYRSPDDVYYATDGHCTHEKTLLCDGLVMDGIIECPKHNGRFDYTSGKALGAPVLVDIRTYPTKVIDGTVYIEIG